MQFQYEYPMLYLRYQQPVETLFMWPRMGNGYIHGDAVRGSGKGRGIHGHWRPFMKGPDMLDVCVVVQQFGDT